MVYSSSSQSSSSSSLQPNKTIFYKFILVVCAYKALVEPPGESGPIIMFYLGVI